MNRRKKIRSTNIEIRNKYQNEEMAEKGNGDWPRFEHVGFSLVLYLFRISDFEISAIVELVHGPNAGKKSVGLSMNWGGARFTPLQCRTWSEVEAFRGQPDPRKNVGWRICLLVVGQLEAT